MQAILRFLPLLFLFSACASSQLVPTVYSVEHPDETALGLEINGREFFLEHMPEDNQQLVFDLEVLNHTHRTVGFDPLELRLYMSNDPFPALSSDNQYALAASHIEQHKGYAAVPPRSAKEVDRFIKRRIRSQRAAQVALLVLGTAMVVHDVVQDANDASKEVITRADVRRAEMRDIATASALVAIDVASSEMELSVRQRFEDLEYLPEEYLASQVLLPGSSARGKVFFRRYQGYAYYRLILPVDGRGYVFDFRRPTGKERKMLRRAQSLH